MCTYRAHIANCQKTAADQNVQPWSNDLRGIKSIEQAQNFADKSALGVINDKMYRNEEYKALVRISQLAEADAALRSLTTPCYTGDVPLINDLATRIESLDAAIYRLAVQRLEEGAVPDTTVDKVHLWPLLCCAVPVAQHDQACL